MGSVLIDEQPSPAPVQEPAVSAKKPRWFFFCIAVILIGIVAFGFSPSFFLRNAMNPTSATRPPLPLYLVFHGVALSCWYLLFAAQTWLVATRRVSVHRTLGVLGAVLAVLVVALSLNVVLRAPARDMAAGQSVEGISLMVIGDLFLVVLFSSLVSLAIANRRKPDVHKRLMALASVSLIAPAIARLPGAEAHLPLSVIVPQLSFCASLIVYDIVTKRRVLAVTGWGVASYLLAIGVAVPLALSDLGHRLVLALR